MPPSFSGRDDFKNFKRSIWNCFPHNPTVADSRFLAAVAESSVRHVYTISAGSFLYRAVCASEWEDDYQNDEVIEGVLIRPCNDDRLFPSKIPNREVLQDGRANPKGIPVFYCAMDEKTAISEIRPINKSLVTIGTFSANRDLRIADCSNASQIPWSDDLDIRLGWMEKTPIKVENYIWHTIGNAYSYPISHSDTERDYLPTQVLAGLFRSLSFDGILYESNITVGVGKNVALFDESAVTLVKKIVVKARVQQPKLKTEYRPDQNNIYGPNDPPW